MKPDHLKSTDEMRDEIARNNIKIQRAMAIGGLAIGFILGFFVKGLL